jgi:hypothetical protein
MKRFVIPAFLALAVAASAQIQSGYGGMQTNGVPASVTSPRPGNSAPGIPPSVTSPRSFPPRTAPVFGTNNGFDRDHDNRFHHHHHNFNNGYVYVWPGYLYDYGDYIDQQQYPPQQMAAEPEAPAQTVFENRPGYKPAPPATTDEAAADAKATSAPVAAEPEPPEPTTLLVFKDGHQEEIGNYVIVGDTLYNISGGYRSYKIPLAQLDLAATVKANEDRGVEFHLPKKNG